MANLVRLILDTTGGDFCPQAPCQAGLGALDLYSDLHLVLAGDEKAILAQIQGKSYDQSRLEILHCNENISNHDHPTIAIREKKDSAIVMGLQSLKKKQANAFVTCGSTGALLAGALLIVGRIRGVQRAALAPLIPSEDKPTLLLDAGANVDCSSENLLQFATMGSIYMQVVCGRQNPKVGLLNIGTEPEKGNELVKETYPKMANLPIHFVGNVEARDITKGVVDVVVADAFSGNVALKSIEGTAISLLKMIKKELTRSILRKFAALVLKPAFKSVKSKLDHQQNPGAPLLGVDGCVFKVHGAGKAQSILLTIGQAMTFVRENVLQEMKTAVEKQHASSDLSPKE